MSEDLEALSLTSVGGKFPSTSFDELITETRQCAVRENR